MSEETRRQVATAVSAIESKKGEELSILELDKASGAFTDYFLVCTGTNPRQIQAICDEIQRSLSEDGVRPVSVEGYNQAEWVLLDYIDFVVHIFSPRSREFYDLERLWKSATRLTAADLKKKPAVKKPAKKTATPRPAKPAKKGARRKTSRKKAR